MKPIRTPECNLTLTLPGGTIDNDLPASRVLLYDSEAGETVEDAQPVIETLWMPDEDEARRLEAGAAVRLRVWSATSQPPVSLTVTDAVVPEAETISRGHVDRALGHLYGELCDAAKRAIDDHDADAIGLDVHSVIPEASDFADLWVAAVAATRPGAQNGQTPDA